MKKSINVFLILVFNFVFVSIGFAQTGKDLIPKVTFVELGSVNCIPCKKMQPVMKAIEKKYGDQIKVVFHDVWKEDQKQYASMYKIKLIPTQVFLDAEGKEFYRHEGFYPESEIDKLLIKKGLVAAVKKDSDD